MDGTSFLAAYGAALSTTIAGSRAYRWLRARRTKLKVEAQLAHASPRPVEPDAEPECAVIWITVINEGERPEQLAWLWVDHFDANGADSGSDGMGDEGAVLASRTRKTYVAAEDAVADQEGADLAIRKTRGSYRIRVMTGGGREFSSPIYDLRR